MGLGETVCWRLSWTSVPGRSNMPLLGKREEEWERKGTGKASGFSSQISMELGHQKCELSWAKKELLELDTGKVDELCLRADKTELDNVYSKSYSSRSVGHEQSCF